MLIDFFFTLRSRQAAGLGQGVPDAARGDEGRRVGPNSDDGPTIDDFYYLSRTALVKDEAHYDKFDRAFAAYFKGVEMLADFTQEIPLEWLRKNAGARAHRRGKGQDREDGLGRADGDAEEALRGAEGAPRRRQQDGSAPAAPRPFGAYGYNPQGIRIGQDKGRNSSAVKVWDQRAYKDYDDSAGTGHAQHQGRAAPAAQVRARGRARKSSTWTTPSARPRPTPATSTSRWCPSATTTSRCCC